MAKAKVASVLIVDDKGEGTGLSQYLKLTKKAVARVLHPEDVELDDLTHADLVLVDYELEDRWWPDRVGCPVSRRPPDGLALASVFRRHIHDIDGPPTGIAILTGKISQLAAPLHPEHREHVLARMSNLEWVFQKADHGDKRFVGDQIAELATAVRGLPKQWPSVAKDAVRQLGNLLAISHDTSLGAQQMEGVTACIPPVHELSQWSHGLAIVRWLLHRILPYPCFLWDSHHLAARMRVDHAWLVNALKGNNALRKWIEPARYKGMLSGFAGERWWRSEVERLLWEKTKRESFDVSSIHRVLKKLTRRDPTRSVPPDHPVVCVDVNYRPMDEFAKVDDAVRIRPDDWPPYADQAWTTVDLARRETRLRALVVHEDRGKLDASAK